MEILVICLLVAAGWWFLSKRNKRKVSIRLDSEGEKWLKEEGIIPDSVKFSVYADPAEVSIPGAKVVVGVGQDRSRTAHGFVYERHPNGSIDGHLLASPAVAMMDKQAAMQARALGDTVIDVLRSRSVEWVAQGKPVTIVDA